MLENMMSIQNFMFSWKTMRLCSPYGSTWSFGLAACFMQFDRHRIHWPRKELGLTYTCLNGGA